MAESPRDASFASLFESAPKQGFARRHRVGEVLDLEVVRVSPEAVLVAVDGKQEGFIDAALLADESGKPTVHVGSRVAARVISIDKSSGEIRLEPLSKDPVVASVGAEGQEGAAATKSGTSLVVGMRIKGKVAGVERYGVFVEFPVPNAPRPERGLVPVAELGTPRGADLRKLFPLGKDIEAAVIAIDERGRVRLSVSALSAAEERRAFESYAGDKAEEQKKETGRGQAGFGTFADLLKKKK